MEHDMSKQNGSYSDTDSKELDAKRSPDHSLPSNSLSNKQSTSMRVPQSILSTKALSINKESEKPGPSFTLSHSLQSNFNNLSIDSDEEYYKELNHVNSSSDNSKISLHFDASNIQLKPVLLPPLEHLKEHIKDNDDKSLKKEANNTSVIIPPIYIEAARARSYLYGRVGGITGSLLGSNELLRHFPDHNITIFVGTWNMNAQNPNDLKDFILPESINTVPDMYAIGIQEGIPDKKEWEVLLQSTIGPSHVLLHSVTLGALHLCIFLRRELIWFCSEVEDDTLSTRPSSLVHTKGAVAICFYFFGTFFLFVNCHLSAHEERIHERIEEYNKIYSSLNLPKFLPLRKKNKNQELVQRFDHIFWLGDLNFRIERDKDDVMNFISSLENSQSPQSYNFLLTYDQLIRLRIEERIFSKFSEAPIKFGPSYKYAIGSSEFDEITPRVPSYTDRILFKTRADDEIFSLHYNKVDQIVYSDHKPVYGVFKALLRPGSDKLPLSAGRFKRNIFIEASNRRSQAMHVPSTSDKPKSSICSIM